LDGCSVKVESTGLVALPTPPQPQVPAMLAEATGRPRVYRPEQAFEMENKPRPLAGGAPRRSTRMVRWIPNLSAGMPPVDLLEHEATWRAPQLRPMPPAPVLRPLPARTNKQGLVKDALRQLPFAKGSRFWKLAPSDLRWAAMVAPVVIGLAWYSLSPKARPSEVEEPLPETAAVVGPGTTIGKAVKPAVNPAVKPPGKPAATRGAKPAAAVAPVPAPPAEEPGFFDSLRDKISARAAIEVSDDFRNGLSAWEGNPGWSDGWSYDQAGFVRPSALALLRPTMHLQDYTFEFLGQIDQRALSWVYRAKDTRNYYAGKLVMVQGGPLPRVHLVRYRVVNGREEGRKSIPVPDQVRLETLYRVKVDVSGNDFTTSVLGKVVDTYSDALHTQGGVGLFSARGEEAKIRWIELSHQYDAVGRLCAFLAPPRVPTLVASEAPNKRGR
jgi:hypothetical protein